MNDQPAHKPVDHIALAGSDAASLASNLWHAGGDCVSAVARGCGEAAHTVGVAAATITDDTITFAANCAAATGQTIEHGVDNTVGTVKAICRENDITPVVKAIIHAPGELYDAVKQREAAFRADRPITAQVESIFFPPLEIAHAIIAGGKNHKQTASIAMTGDGQPHPWSELEGMAPGKSYTLTEYLSEQGNTTVIREQAHNVPSLIVSRTPDGRVAYVIDNRDNGRDGGSDNGSDGGGEGHSGRGVRPGESYWSIAAEQLRKGASNQEIADQVAKLKELNHNKPLQVHDGILLH